jgi:hypothetical protein
MPPADGYDNTFHEADNDKNIIILDKNDPSLVDSDVDVNIPQVKGATLVKLVERVTYGAYAGNF